MKSQRGFTLIELMIVVGVIAILAMFAIPSYLEYVRKGKRSDGVRVISELQLGLERYRSECPTYVNSPLTCLGLVYPIASASSYYTVTISGQSTTGYTVTAVPKTSFSDPKCANLIMTNVNSVSTPTSSGTQSSDYCWRK